MFEKYNEKARRALFFARYEASKLGSRVIEAEHVLLGILREGEESVMSLFGRFDVKPDEIRREIEGERVFVERVSSTADLPLSDETKKVLAYAAHEAEGMAHRAVGSEHLMIGILRVESCLAMRVLTHAGLDHAAAQLRRLIAGEEQRSTGFFVVLLEHGCVVPFGVTFPPELPEPERRHYPLPPHESRNDPPRQRGDPSPGRCVQRSLL